MTPHATPGAGSVGCWNCRQPLPVGSPRCLYCGVPQDAPSAQLVVAPHGVVAPASAAAYAPGSAPAAPAAIPPVPGMRPARGAVAAGPSPLGEAFAGTPAGAGVRLAAFSIDVAIVVVLAVGVGFWLCSVPLAVLVGAELVVGLWAAQARTGSGPGALLLRLRVARVEAPFTPGAGRAAMRALVTLAGAVAFGIGAWIVEASGAWDGSGKRRSWADHAGRTVVVSVPTRASRAAASAVPRRPGVLIPPAPSTPLAPPRAATALHSAAAAPAGVPAAPPAVAAVAVPADPRPPQAPSAAPPVLPMPAPQPMPVASAHAAAPVQQAAQAAPAPAAAPHPPVTTPPVAVPPAPAQPEASAPAPIRRRRQPPTTPAPPTAAPAAANAEPGRLGAPVEAGADRQQLARTATPVARGGAVPRDEQSTLTPGGPAPADALLLVFDTGQRAQVPPTGATVLGRNPAAVEAGDAALVVRDPESTVSKSHARLEATRAGLWITDLGSTNGTELLDEDGDVTALAAHTRTPVDEGGRVRIGNRVFTIGTLIGATA